VSRRVAVAAGDRTWRGLPVAVMAWLLISMGFLAVTAAGCGGAGGPAAAGDSNGGLGSVVAAESFLADIAQNVAGDRLTVGTLLPLGADPHGFEPTPADVRKVAEAGVLIINGTGFEGFLDDLLAGAGNGQMVVEASAGLVPRHEGESAEHATGDAAAEAAHSHEQGDPHFWLDPVNVKTYVENISQGLAVFDPEGADEYAVNAAAYVRELDQLDAWVREQIQTIAPERRLLVTNHDSFSYFAERYGLRVVGTVLPGASTGAAPSAQQMSRLIADMKTSGAPAIFLEAGANTQLAEQIARDTGAIIVTGLYTHSTSGPEGEAPTYLDMIRYNTAAIVGALR